MPYRPHVDPYLMCPACFQAETHQRQVLFFIVEQSTEMGDCPFACFMVHPALDGGALCPGNGYNAVSNKWQYLNSYTDGIITADTAGRYLLTNQNLKFANINWTFFIAGGVVVVLIGIAYVVLKKRYWFW